MHIRPATEADLPELVAMLIDDELGSTREDLSTPLNPRYLEAFNAIDADPNQMVLIAERDGQIAGTFQLSFLPGLSHKGSWRGQIEAVRTAAKFRGQGVGAQMMQWAIEASRERGCRMVQLTTNKTRKDAHRFYDRLGFVASHEGYKLIL